MKITRQQSRLPLLAALLGIITKYSKTTTFFRQKFVLDTFMTLFRAIILIFVYVNIYRIAPQAQEVLPFKSAVWSMGAYFIALSFNARRMYKTISDLIYSGNIELYLMRPIHALLFAWAQLLGGNIIQSFVTSIIVLLVLIFAIGVPFQITGVFILIALLTLALGVIIETLIGIIIGLLAIWLENSTPIYWIVDKFVLLLGGSYVPVAFFPEVVKNIAIYSPFGATRFVTYSFYPNYENTFVFYLELQVMWIILLYLSVILLFNKGKRYIFINGS